MLNKFLLPQSLLNNSLLYHLFQLCLGPKHLLYHLLLKFLLFLHHLFLRTFQLPALLSLPIGLFTIWVL